MHAPYKLHKDDKLKSRFKRLSSENENHPSLKLPEIDECDHIVQWFYQSGMGMSGANGLTALTWQELESFSALSGLNLTAWESEMLMAMSRTYSTSYHKSQEPDSPTPWVDESEETLEEMRANVAAKFRAISAGAMPKTTQAAKKPHKKAKPA